MILDVVSDAISPYSQRARQDIRERVYINLTMIRSNHHPFQHFMESPDQSATEACISRYLLDHRPHHGSRYSSSCRGQHPKL